MTINPHLKVEVALELYKDKEISLEKAAEIAGMGVIEFRELISRKVKKEAKLFKNRFYIPSRVYEGLLKAKEQEYDFVDYALQLLDKMMQRLILSKNLLVP
jgi:hypothetical protein